MQRFMSIVVSLGAMLWATSAAAEKVMPTAEGKGASWSALRATGPRDVLVRGDSPNGWATTQADAGAEWLELKYAETMSIKEIRIWQNDAPGAISRVTVEVDGKPVEVWSGTAPAPAGNQPVEMVVTLAKPYLTDTVTVHLDTSRVSGWNEIDAVEVVATDGRRAWASDARASTSYASGTGAAVHPLSHLIGKRVVLRVDGVTLTGTLTAADHTWYTLDDGDVRRLIAAASVAFVEWRK